MRKNNYYHKNGKRYSSYYRKSNNYFYQYQNKKSNCIFAKFCLKTALISIGLSFIAGWLVTIFITINFSSYQKNVLSFLYN